MEHYGVQPGFWKEFIIIMGAVVILLIGIPPILRHRMGADKKKWFSNNYINEFHEKGDWALRISFMISLIAGVIIFTFNPLIVLLISFFFTVIQIGFQAYVEWKFTENRKNYKVSLVEVGLFLVCLIGVLLWFEK